LKNWNLKNCCLQKNTQKVNLQKPHKIFSLLKKYPKISFAKNYSKIQLQKTTQKIYLRKKLLKKQPARPTPKTARKTKLPFVRQNCSDLCPYSRIANILHPRSAPAFECK
jgi:hypothetical protein